MKINNTQKRKSKKLFLPLLIVAILLASWLVFAYIKGAWPFRTEARNDTAIEQAITPEEQAVINAENAKEKQDFLDKEESEASKDSEADIKSNSETQEDSPKINLSARTQDDLLVVTTELGSVNSGKCKLTLKQGEKSVWKTAKVIFAPGSSTCEGFSIKKSELDSGTWQITLAVETDNDTFTKSINYDL